MQSTTIHQHWHISKGAQYPNIGISKGASWLPPLVDSQAPSDVHHSARRQVKKKQRTEENVFFATAKLEEGGRQVFFLKPSWAKYQKYRYMWLTQNRERRGNCDFVPSIKLAVETPMLLRDQLLDLFTTSQVVKQSRNYANYPNLLASDFNTHQ